MFEVKLIHTNSKNMLASYTANTMNGSRKILVLQFQTRMQLQTG